MIVSKLVGSDSKNGLLNTVVTVMINKATVLMFLESQGIERKPESLETSFPVRLYGLSDDLTLKPRARNQGTRSLCPVVRLPISQLFRCPSSHGVVWAILGVMLGSKSTARRSPNVAWPLKQKLLVSHPEPSFIETRKSYGRPI